MSRVPLVTATSLLTFCFLASLAGFEGTARASHPAHKTSAPSGTHGNAPSKPGARKSLPKPAAGKVRANDGPVRPPAPQLEGKIAVFVFAGDGEGEDGEPRHGRGTLRRPVLALLRSKGLTPITDLRTVDLPDQFRDMATALHLVAYVHGKVQSQRDKRRLTLYVRNGFSGRKAGALVTTVPAEGWNDTLDEKLWRRLFPLVQRACADAKRPRPRSRTMEINAGTPLEPTTPDEDDLPG